MARDSKGRFTKKKTRRNLDAFTSGGKIHPIRGSRGYDSAIGDRKRTKA